MIQVLLVMVSAALGSAAVPAATYKVGSREGTFAEEGNKDLHWLEQDATRMVHIFFLFLSYTCCSLLVNL